jgi:hypothetical protein
MSIIEIEKDVPLPPMPEVDGKTVPIPSQRLGKLPINEKTGLNSREEKFVEVVLHGKKGTLGKEVQKIYAEEGTEITAASASVRASELRKTSGVMAILKEAEEEAQHGIIEIARYAKALGKTGGKEGAAYAGVALSAEKEILDRVHGKAKQSVDVTTRSVTINMDLTQSLPEDTV